MHLRPNSSNLQRRRFVAFTLVEMLVVMGIIVILLAALLPAVRGLSNSTSRRGAVGTLLGVLDRARMMAINDGLSTYVVFACPGGDGQKLKPELWGQAYAIYEDHDNISFTPEQRTPWTRLPLGMALKIDAGGAGQYTSVTNRVLQATTDPTFPLSAGALSSSGTASAQLPYWKFDGTGAVDEQSPSYLRLLIFPGVISTAGQEVPTQNTGGGAGNTTSVLLEEIDINSATGRAKYIINPTNNLATPTPTPST